MTGRGKNIIVAVTGASGSIYARQVVDGLLAINRRGCGIAENEGKSEYGTDTFQLSAGRMELGPNGSAIALEAAECKNIGLIVSRRGEEVAAWEGVKFWEHPHIERFSNDDMFASPASGSARWDAMVIVPCSMGCMGRIAAGISSDLIARAADVMLKEGRPLIVVPRETPLNLIHLRNLTTLAEAGAVVLPASPSFYSHPATIDEVCATVTDRILTRLGIAHGGYEWGANG